VAIVQISQITNRKGLAVDLPQLAGAELGWSTDTRQLFIGNGTLQDGAPVIGNTEILTQFSDILNFINTYTYKGQAAGYTVQTGETPGTPVSLSLQQWFDQYASVLDFGAVPDGLTDCTDAINRALYQLYCREINPQIRRSLFFPAGVYRVTGSINIPPYATLYGEGNDNSIIVMDTGVSDYVARTADSLQNTGVNIGDAGAIPPQYITITNMGFTHSDPTQSVFLVQDATNMTFQNVGFRGTSTTANLNSDTNQSSGISFSSTPALTCEQIVFESCIFSGLVWGINTSNDVNAVTVNASQFETLYRGIVLGTSVPATSGPNGVRITGNMFDSIYAEGIIFGVYSNLNASGYNIFYDVGNYFTGVTGTPSSSIISIQSNNNVSIGDLFARTDAYATTYPRINLNETTSIATTNGELTQQGTYARASGTTSPLTNNNTGTVATVSTNTASAFKFDYTIVRGSLYRTGSILVAAKSSGPTWSDDFVGNGETGVSLSVAQSGTSINFNYTTTNTGTNGTILYSITYLA
jgi:hypothetical protein